MATKIGTTYYVSASEGCDSNSGKSKKSPWKSFKKINAKVLKPGDKILLKRGDVWHERLEIYGGGSVENPVTVSAYGDKDAYRPTIQLNNGIDDICVLISDVRYTKSGKNQLHECSNLIIEELDLRDSYLCLYFRIKFLPCKNLTVRNIYFHNNFCDETLAPMATKNGGCLEEMHKQGAKVKGNLPIIDLNKKKATAPTGAPGEYLFAHPILFSSNYSNIEICDIVMYNNFGSIDLIGVKNAYVHDVVCFGAAIKIEYDCENVTVERVRMLSGNEKYTFWGGTCGAYLADSRHNVIRNNELSYEYNHGENDGCGLDFEYQCAHTTIENNVFHHNDSGSMLFMGLAEGKQHDDVVVRNNLSYANVRNPKNPIYNYEFLCGVLGFQDTENTVKIRGNEIYLRKIAKGNRTFFFGSIFEESEILRRICEGIPTTPNNYPVIHENNNLNPLEKYRTRFAFLKDYNLINFQPEKSMLHVQDGKATVYPQNGVGAIKLTTAINGFCYTKLRIVVANGFKGKTEISYTLSDGTVKTASAKIVGKGEYIVSLADKPIYSILRDVTIAFKPSRGNTPVELDYIEFLPDITASAKKVGENEIEVTFGGISHPMVALELDAANVKIDGYTVTGIEMVKYNTVKVLVREKVSDLSGVKITAKADLFIKYFKDLINGLDCERTAEDEAKLFGSDKVKPAYYNGEISFIVK